MRHWKADLLGLAIGFSLGGIGLFWLGPALGFGGYLDPAAWRPPAAVAPPPTAAPPPAPQPMVSAAAEPLSPTPKLSRPALPAVVHPAGGAAAGHVVTLPTIIHPSETAPGTGMAGTGFFVSGDGTLVTAAHVVSGCQRMQVASQRVRLAPARLLAANPDDDIALLRVDGIRPPAILPLGLPVASTQQLFVLGYPARAGALVPEETWGTLANQHLPAFRQPTSDVRETVWLHAAAVTHGYSGGPMLDPRTGAVVGIVKGGIEPKYLHLMRDMPSDGVTIGPGAAMLARFIRRAAPEVEAVTERVVGVDSLDAARRATVHVFCWH